MFITRFVPPGFMRDVELIAFVTDNVETAKRFICEKLGQDLSFKPGAELITVKGVNGEDYADLVYDTTGNHWQARTDKNGHVTIKPIEFIQ